MIQAIARNLPGKAKSKKGFTLAELLIVVAIIAILVAIAIPVFTSSLNKANEAVDKANERAAKGVAVADYLTNNIDSATAGTVTYYFDAEKGTVSTNTADKPATGYNKTTKNSLAANTACVQVEVKPEGATVTWVAVK